jgi:hypothetical protein
MNYSSDKRAGYQGTLRDSSTDRLAIGGKSLGQAATVIPFEANLVGGANLVCMTRPELGYGHMLQRRPRGQDGTPVIAEVRRAATMFLSRLRVSGRNSGTGLEASAAADGRAVQVALTAA